MLFLNLDVETPKKDVKRSYSDTQLILSDRGTDKTSLPKRKRAIKPYKPKSRSGAWAILIALFRNTSEDEFLESDAIKNLAEPLSSTSMWPDTSKTYSYSAWSSNSILVEKGLIIRKLKPTRFCLSLEGRNLAEKLDKEDRADELEDSDLLLSVVEPGEFFDDQSIRLVQEIYHNQPPETKPSRSLSYSTISFQRSGKSTISSKPLHRIEKPNGIRHCSITEIFVDLEEDKIVDIMLIVDNREKKDYDHNFFCDALKLRDISASIRQLSVGDFLWIGTTEKGKEVVLDTIIERKKVADLCSSIVSGRYTEQKWRLAHSGLSKVIYLVEGSITAWQIQQCRVGNLSVDSIEMAMISTHSNDGFTVLQTIHHQSTIDKITAIHDFIEQKWMGQTIYTTPTISNIKYAKVRYQKMTKAFRDGYRIRDTEKLLFMYDQFQQNNVKTKALPIKDTFGLQLMSCNRCSADAAAAIVNIYKTPKGLASAYTKATTLEEKRMLLKNIPVGPKRKVGPLLSTTIYESFWLGGNS